MNRIGLALLNLSVALYLFTNGIFGFIRDRGEFGTMVRTIFGRGDSSDVIIAVLSVCAIMAAALLLLSLFRIDVPITDVFVLIFIIIWLIFIVIIDIINPITSRDSLFHRSLLDYIRQLAAHLMVLGALISTTKRGIR